MIIKIDKEIFNKSSLLGIYTDKKEFYLLDTGSNICLLNKELDNLSNKKSSIKIIGIDGSNSESNYCQERKLIFSNNTLVFSFVLTDLSNLQKELQSVIKINKLCGIIGNNFLMQYKGIIDFNNLTLSIN